MLSKVKYRGVLLFGFLFTMIMLPCELWAVDPEIVKREAEMGKAVSQCLLGSWYEYGIMEMPKDDKKAAFWYTKAAKQGLDFAQYKLGMIYYNGLGVPKDYRQAITWYTKAAEKGYGPAQFDLGGIYISKEGVPEDCKKSLYWFTKAAEQGNPRAQFMLWSFYSNDACVEKDSKQAVAWLTKAAEKGYSLAQNKLGEIYETGTGVPQNYQHALTWYTKAAEQGYAEAWKSLGLMYCGGRGEFQSYALGYAWLSLAAAEGDEEAIMFRDLAAKHLGTQEISKAQKWATEIQERISHPEAKSVHAPSEPPPQIPDTPPPRPTVGGVGSGFIFTSDGYVLTCAHVVERASSIKVKYGERILVAKMVRMDKSSDLAILKVSFDNPLPTLNFAKDNHATLGQDVFTVGFPNPELQGVAAKLTKGSVSSLSGVQDDSRHYQISVPVQPGNSGGPLLDTDGNVVGVVDAQIMDLVALASSGSLPQNINYAVKSSYALSLINSIPDVGGKLIAPNSRPRPFPEVASDAEKSVVLVWASE